MKPDKHLAAAAAIFTAACCLIALTWLGTTRAIYAQRVENTTRVTAMLGNQALTLSEQINRQILTLDQTLRILAAAWETDPRGFDLEAWRKQAVVLNGLSRDMVLTDEKGIIRQSSVVEAIDQNASGSDYFRALSNPIDPGHDLFIGPAMIDGLMRQWHMNVARPLRRADGSFAGVLDTDYRIAGITEVFSETDLGPGAFVALIGLDDGKLRGAVGPGTIDPDASVADTPMFVAMKASDHGIWTGPSPTDAMQRIHAFHAIAGRNLAVVVAMSEDVAMRPAAIGRQQAQLFAGCITALLAGVALLLIQGMRLSRRRGAAMAEDRAILAASNAQFEVARALAAAKAEQLETTLDGMSDGVFMLDAHLCLVDWNARFPELAGVPAESLRVGLPMEEILKVQASSGHFGEVADPDAEVARRMASLRVAPPGVSHCRRPNGHTLELRRARLSDGGFVTLYVDVTGNAAAAAALREAQATAEAANAEKSRFVAIASHEIRTPLNALLNTIRLLSDSELAPAQRSLLAMARQSGDVLYELTSDILDISQMEAGKLSIRPSLFELRPLLDSCIEMFAGQAAACGFTFSAVIAEGTPEMLVTDPGRLRQVQLNLLSNALRYARPDNVWLLAEPGRNAHEGVRLTVRDAGPLIAPDARARLFQPFSRLERLSGDETVGTGLGLSICHHLMTLMGGTISCEAWSSPDGQEGNAFIVILPATALPLRAALAGMPPETGCGKATALPPRVEGDAIIEGIDLRRRLPRTRILLAEDIIANQIVTATLLRRAGHQVDIASSGEAAVQAMRTTPYDLVLMDIFMPGIGGQGAAQLIRSLPEPACSTPIVALTANVAPENEAVCTAAGMDGMLGKPVSLPALLAVVRRHVWSAKTARAASEASGPGKAAASTAERSRITPVLAADRIQELRSNLPPDTFADLIEECLRDMDHRLPALRRALAAGAPAAVTNHAHALVGMAAGYGMSALELRLRTIMATIREGDLAVQGPSIAAQVDMDYKEAARALRSIGRSEVV